MLRSKVFLLWHSDSQPKQISALLEDLYLSSDLDLDLDLEKWAKQFDQLSRLARAPLPA